MTKTQAEKKLSKLLGREIRIQDSGRPTSPEQRASDTESRRIANQSVKEIESAMTARKIELLKADSLYQSLREKFTIALKERKAISFPSYRYKSGQVSVIGGFGVFSVDAEADSLEELIQKFPAVPRLQA